MERSDTDVDGSLADLDQEALRALLRCARELSPEAS
ncbi:hypothetical protein JOE59_003586 [Agromyces cerinus]|nr:hypothetical protein [Agromyces cerinus]